MSERKSWDVQRKPQRAKAAAPASDAQPVPRAPAPARASRPLPRPVPRPVRPVEPARTRQQAPRPERTAARPSPRRAPLPAGTLRERRSRRRRVARTLFFVFLALLVAAFFYLVWRPTFRIANISASGPGAESAKQIAASHLTGAYWHIIPRNSTFFYPSGAIRQAILQAVPEAAAVSLSRTSFTSLSVHTLPREQSFVWCGTSIDTPNPGGCYQADVQGYIFAQVTDDSVVSVAPVASSSASSTQATKQTRGQVRLYAPLTKELADGQSPIRAQVVSAQYMFNALRFVDAVRTLGASVTALAIRGDEADLWIGSKTRITFVLGHEQQATATAASALPTLNVNDASIQYIDLRFDGKAYVKKYGS